MKFKIELMNTIYRNLNIIVVLAIILTSCTKEEVQILPEQQLNKGSISFGSILSNLRNSENSKLIDVSQLEIPDCKPNRPLIMRVALKDSKGSWVHLTNSEDHFIDIKIKQAGVDTNNDGELDSWFAQESDQIELSVDTYTLEYFAVLDKSGVDAQVLYLTPRKSENYGAFAFQNFVKESLPLDIPIREGVKHYVPVEVLCYNRRFAEEFGYSSNSNQ